MYQFQIYPSGDVSNYRMMVNHISGVSAILDRRMGIIEHSLSGVAFYIKAIQDYVNIHNVGTRATPITSGYFNHVGFTNYATNDSYPFKTSLDGVVSGVNNIYSVNVNIYGDNYIKSLVASSGLISNCILDNAVVALSNINSLNFTGTISNLYSGFISNYENILPIEQPTPINDGNYPYKLGPYSVLNNMATRINGYDNGIIDGCLIYEGETFAISGAKINVSGNVYINGNYKPNLSWMSSDLSISEHVFNLDHNHDGVVSSAVPFSSFSSSIPVKKEFSVSTYTGDMVVDKTFNGNSIGLSSNWEEVELRMDINEIQKLITCKDRLYVVDNNSMRDLETGDFITGITYFNYPKSAVIATVDGDSPALIEFSSINGEYNVYDQHITITKFNTKQSVDIYFPFSSRIGTQPPHSIVSRKELPVDAGVRLGCKYYIPFLEIYEYFNISRTLVQYTALALYEINTIDNTIKQVAVSNIPDTITTFFHPIRYKNGIFYNFTDSASESYCLSYNVINRATASTQTITGVTYIDREVYTGTDFEFNYGFYTHDNIMVTGKIKPFTFNTTYFLSQVFSNNFRMFSSQRNRFTFMNQFQIVADTTCIAYAGRVWSGHCLENARDVFYRDTSLSALVDRMKVITQLPNPWLIRPVIYRGWLYAIAPVTERVTDSMETTNTVREIVPTGSKLVRRRAAEVDLNIMNAYTL